MILDMPFFSTYHQYFLTNETKSCEKSHIMKDMRHMRMIYVILYGWFGLCDEKHPWLTESRPASLDLPNL